jgi:uncharacterized protein YbjT (DUF2867 family)
MNETIVVAGATGNVGAELVRLLAAESIPIRAAVPDVAKAHAKLGPDVPAAHFEFDRPEPHAAAFDGARALFLMRPPQIADTRVIAPAIDAAKRAGVEHIVFLSLYRASNGTQSSPTTESSG